MMIVHECNDDAIRANPSNLIQLDANYAFKLALYDADYIIYQDIHRSHGDREKNGVSVCECRTDQCDSYVWVSDLDR